MDNVKIRAIYINDMMHENCPVFELNHDNGYFEMISDKAFKYAVYEDEDFLIYQITEDDSHENGEVYYSFTKINKKGELTNDYKTN